MSNIAVLDSFGPSELIYPVIAAAAVAGSLAFLTRPFVNLVLLLSYLVVANNAVYVLGLRWSAAITALLIANCLAGVLLTSRPRLAVLGNLARPVVLLCSVAALSAAYGLVLGNPASFVFGDLYQILEFTSLLVLSRMLVTTERQLRAVALALVIATIITSVLQTVDAVMDAPYLPGMEGLRTKRIINMYTPIAFTVLLALFPSARHRLLLSSAWRSWSVTPS
jgi:hypothetical protein